MNSAEDPSNVRAGSRRRRRSAQDGTPRVLSIKRKPRHQGAFGWLRKNVYSQRSPLITVAVLIAGFALMAGILIILNRTPPNLPPGVATPMGK